MAVDQHTGVAAGVPYVAVPPEGGPRTDAPVVVAWHLLDPPRTESALAAQVPLAGLDAWRIYLGLPMSGSRMPAGGPEEVMRLAMEDAVLNLHQPLVEQAVGEAGPAMEQLRAELGIDDGPVAVLGGSMGSAVAQLVLVERVLDVRAAVLVSPLTDLRTFVDAYAAMYGTSYAWSERADALAARMAFTERAPEFVAAGSPPVLMVVGAEDHPDAFQAPAQRLREALAAAYDDPSTVTLELVAGMGHGLTEEPGVEPEPQTVHGKAVDDLATGWFHRHLTGLG